MKQTSRTPTNIQTWKINITWMNDWTNEEAGERMDDRTSERTKSRRIDEWAYEQDNEKLERWTNGQTDKRTNGQTDKRTNGQTDKRTNGRMEVCTEVLPHWDYFDFFQAKDSRICLDYLLISEQFKVLNSVLLRSS